MQAYIDGKDIEQLYDGNYITVTNLTAVELICPYNVYKFRIKRHIVRIINMLSHLIVRPVTYFF